MSNDLYTTVNNTIKKLKASSGSHSPSIDTILDKCPELKIKVDACFLSNPYATDLFIEFLNKDLINSNKFRDTLEYYPPQNKEVAENISRAIKIDRNKIFVGNGAIEIIQAVLHNFVKEKICIISPTFSSYYEFVQKDKEVIYYELKKDESYLLNPQKYVNFVKENKADTIVLINPNNPNGGYLKGADINYILKNLTEVDNIIIDESFIHFAYENIELSQITFEEMITKYPNLIIIKSMSKDFGIAGIRAGYAVMNDTKVDYLLKYGYLWNISGLANYFFKVYSNQDFIKKYEIVRKKYIMNTLMFLNEISNIKGLKVYPTKANFALIEIKNGMTSFEFTIKLLVNYGIYVRDCSDKIGLEGEFVRIASRSFEENLLIIKALKEMS
ncbi:histidinol-phosphate aminotransferase family protein [Flavobacteriaceae bacterium]|nr:histidinol-phosphate aminotransferase family protein [Flavobacteriaceae bacterium]